MLHIPAHITRPILNRKFPARSRRSETTSRTSDTIYPCIALHCTAEGHHDEAPFDQRMPLYAADSGLLAASCGVCLSFSPILLFASCRYATWRHPTKLRVFACPHSPDCPSNYRPAPEPWGPLLTGLSAQVESASSFRDCGPSPHASIFISVCTLHTARPYIGWFCPG